MKLLIICRIVCLAEREKVLVTYSVEWSLIDFIRRSTVQYSGWPSTGKSEGV